VAAARTGVLAMAYGTADTPDQIEAFYTHIRHGRRPSDELLADLRRRYRAIGGRSPLFAITRAQTEALNAALTDAGQPDLIVSLGFKHAPPFIEAGVAELLAAGMDHIVGLVLAPHYSRLSIGEYAERARAAAAAAPQPPRFTIVRDWHLAPGYLELLARALRDAFAALPAQHRARAHTLFTAHSLPARILEQDDPYPDQLRETAAAVAELAGVERWSVAWQSAGRTPEPWIGPDVLEVLGQLREQSDAVVVCPAGFVTDHLEVLYDLDIEARARAEDLGLAFGRTASPNAAPELARTLAGVVLDHLAEYGR
jgi:ferrochelatase